MVKSIFYLLLWVWLGLVGEGHAQTVLTQLTNQSAVLGSGVTFRVNASNSVTYTTGFNFGNLDGWPHTNVFYTGRSKGTLNFSYLFGGIADRLTVYYDGNRIYDTDYISGSKTRTFTVGYGPGTNMSVTVIINEGNYNLHGSTWEYHLTMMAPSYYQWQFNTTNILGATNDTYAVNNVSNANAGTYGVVVTNNFGPDANAAATLTVLVPPAIIQPATNLTVLAGVNTNFSVRADGSPTPTYQWQKNGTNIPGATSDSYYFPSAQASDAGNYTVVITNVAGRVTNTAILKVLVSPTLTGVSGNSTNFGFAYPSVIGSTYVIQYKPDLNDLSWTPIATNTGTGSFLNYSVSTAGFSNRFYRVVVR